MTTATPSETSPELGASTIARTVLDGFLADLAATEGFAAIAARLRDLAASGKSLSEAEVRKALFSDDEP